MFIFLNIERRKVSLNALLGIELIGLIFSMILTYLQIFVLEVVCPYCLTSAIVTIILFGMSFWLKKLNFKLVI